MKTALCFFIFLFFFPQRRQQLPSCHGKSDDLALCPRPPSRNTSSSQCLVFPHCRCRRGRRCCFLLRDKRVITAAELLQPAPPPPPHPILSVLHFLTDLFVCAGCQTPYPRLRHPVGAQLPGVPSENPAGELLTHPDVPPVPPTLEERGVYLSNYANLSEPKLLTVEVSFICERAKDFFLIIVMCVTEVHST